MITPSAVLCAPPGNAPTPAEQATTCRPHLDATIAALRRLRVIVTLGDVARRNVLKALGAPVSSMAGGHGAWADVAGYRVINSYHCSRLNLNTGRLTPEAFAAIFRLARGALPSRSCASMTDARDGIPWSTRLTRRVAPATERGALNLCLEAAGVLRREGGDVIALASAIRHSADLHEELRESNAAWLAYEAAWAVYRTLDPVPDLDLANCRRPMALWQERRGSPIMALSL